MMVEMRHGGDDKHDATAVEPACRRMRYRRTSDWEKMARGCPSQSLEGGERRRGASR